MAPLRLISHISSVANGLMRDLSDLLGFEWRDGRWDERLAGYAAAPLGSAGCAGFSTWTSLQSRRGR